MHIPDIAYIDPNSGSMIIQGAIASIVAAAVFFRDQIGRVIGKLRRSDDTTDSATSVDDAAQGG